MAATSARAATDGDGVESIMDNMNYGSAMDSDSSAKAWLDDHERQFGHFIGNQWRKSDSGKSGQAHNPATGELLATVGDASEADVEAAAKAARAAAQTWASLSDNARARHLYSVTRNIQKHQQLFAVLETLDTGRAMRESKDTEVPQAVRLLYHYTGWAQLREEQLQGYRPYGVVAVLPSSSRPLVSMVQRVAVALATGNTVVVCPDPATPLSALLFAEVCREAGLPQGVVNVVTDGSGGGARKRLVLREEVDKVAFAGSTQAGQTLRQLTAGSGKSVSLELSGSSAMLVFDSADLDSVVEGVVDAGWGYAGQLNTSVARLLVHEPVCQRLAGKLARRLQTVKVGPSLEKNMDVGAVTDQTHLDKLKMLVEEARQEGAQVFQASTENCKRGTFYPPTLVVGAQAASRIVYEDVVGPVVCVVPFRTAKEGLALANNSVTATAASVWTENISLAMEVSAGLQAGVVWVNSHNTVDAAVGAGGPKHSGSGRIGGRRGLLEYVRPAWLEREAPCSQDLNLATFGSAVAPRPSTTVAAVGQNGDGPKIDATHKLYYGGAQKRPGGQYSRAVVSPQGALLGQVSEAAAADVLNAVDAAAKAQPGWGKRVGHNRAQILYYIAENLEQQTDSMAALLTSMTSLTGQDRAGEGRAEVSAALDRLFYWAAWCDKNGGSVQEVPVYGTVYESNDPVGVIGVVCPDSQPLLAFVSLFAAAIARGNAVVMIPSEKFPLAAIQMYQVFDTSDLPGGVVNILTGPRDHLTKALAEHHDVSSLWYFGSPAGSKYVEHAAAGNLKRTWVNNGLERDFGNKVRGQGEEFLFHATQPKSVWVPMGDIFAN